MEPFTMLMLSMQAAGVVTSLWSAHSADKQIKQGRQLEKAAIDMNLEAVNYEYQESSLASMQALRKNLATQAVMQAARGGATGTEGAVVSAQKSISASGADQEAKRMRMLAKEADLRAANVLSGLHTLQSETELGRQVSKGLFEAASTGLNVLGASDTAIGNWLRPKAAK